MVKQFCMALGCVIMASAATHATKAIGNWDCVPYQMVDTPFKLGIVAFHETGVDVEMFADGTSLGTVSDPAYNDRTDCYEYWVELNPADYADGPVYLTATITPDGAGHEARTLDTLLLYANGGGTLSNDAVVWVDCDNGDDAADGSETTPYATVEKGVTSVGAGGTVYLKAGRNYKLTSLYSTAYYRYWTTVRAAPGLTRDDVHIAGYDSAGTSTGRYNDSGVRWCNVAFYTDADSGSFHTIFYINSGQRVWFDSTELFDKNGQWASGSLINNQGGLVYSTNCYVHDIANGLGGLRGNYNENICSDIYRPGNNLLSINMTVSGIDVGPTAAHPDFWQCYCTDGVKENCILYNCRAYNMGAQGIFGCNEGCGLKDVAFVNLLLEKDPPSSSLMSQPGRMEHVLIYHFTTVDQSWYMRTPETNVGWVVKDCNWAHFGAGDVDTLPGQDISHCHTKSLSWDQPAAFGTDSTTGSQGWVDYDNDNYRVADTSACYMSGIPLPGVPADIDNVLYDAVSPNRGCFAAGNNGAVRHPQRAVYTGLGPVWLNNPFTRRLTVETKDGGSLGLALYAMDGSPVACTQQGNALVTDNVAGGVYLLHVMRDGRGTVVRVVKTE